MERSENSRPGRSTPRVIRGWVDPRASLDVVEEREIQRYKENKTEIRHKVLHLFFNLFYRALSLKILKIW
jgi:hypothetical protein